MSLRDASLSLTFAFFFSTVLLSVAVQPAPLAAQQTIPGKIIPDEEIASEDQEKDQEDAESVSTTDADDTESNLDFLYGGELPTTIEQLKAMEKHVAEITERCKKATVNIMVTSGAGGGAQGSGVVVSRDGYILTAAHVISRPRQMATITFEDGTQVKAQTLGVHHGGVDSGMLKIIDEGRWPYVDMGESESLEDGQWVFAVGHPGGYDKDRGIVLRVGRLINNEETVMQTDCTLVGGDSGGPLLDMYGDLIGIHSRIGRNLTDNYHVPVDVFSDEWDDLADGRWIGRPARAWVGLSLEGDTNEVREVSQFGPALEAGLEKGDIVLMIGDQEIENRSDMGTALRSIEPGDVLTVKVKRDDEELEFELEVMTR